MFTGFIGFSGFRVFRGFRVIRPTTSSSYRNDPSCKAAITLQPETHHDITLLSPMCFFLRCIGFRAFANN